VPIQPTYQSDAASNHSHPALLSGKLVAELCREFLPGWLSMEKAVFTSQQKLANPDHVQ